MPSLTSFPSCTFPLTHAAYLPTKPPRMNRIINQMKAKQGAERKKAAEEAMEKAAGQKASRKPGEGVNDEKYGANHMIGGVNTQQQQVDTGSATKGTNSNTVKKGAERRVQTEIAGGWESTLGSKMVVKAVDDKSLLHWILRIKPDSGFYQGGHFSFSIDVPHDYPLKPPKVLGLQTIYHPNIDLQRKVCLNILREEWNPVLELNIVFFGLYLLFSEPNPSDPLNKEAAEMLRNNPELFKHNVKMAMSGRTMNGVQYTDVTKGFVENGVTYIDMTKWPVQE